MKYIIVDKKINKKLIKFLRHHLLVSSSNHFLISEFNNYFGDFISIELNQLAKNYKFRISSAAITAMFVLFVFMKKTD